MALDALGRLGLFSRGKCSSFCKGIPSETPSTTEWDGGQTSSNVTGVSFKLTSAAAAPLSRLCTYRHGHALTIAAISNLAAGPLKDGGPATRSSSSRRVTGHFAGKRWSSEGRLCRASINGGWKSGRGGENSRWSLHNPVQDIEHSRLASHNSLHAVMSYARGRDPDNNSSGHHQGREPWSYVSNNVCALKGPGESRRSDMRSPIRKHSKRFDFPWPKGVDDPRSQPLTSAKQSILPRRNRYHGELPSRQVFRNCIPQPRDTPPQRDTGIASEKDWNINLKNELSTDSGINEDGSTWYRECGEDFGDNGYRCRWTVMGGKNGEGSSEWREVWWEKSDWTGYKELGAEKSGKTPKGDSWWETWQEVLRQDDWSNLARIERSAQKQAKSGSGSAGWYEKWWEKYNPKGWSEKGAHKYGRLNDQGWWEKWGEQYDGRGAVLKWTDKWAETDLGTKWGDKWEEKFTQGIGTRQGETWHYSANGERWSRTWGEEHAGTGKVHKYGKSTSGESWDSVVDEGTFYQAEPHYGWADAVANSVQLLAIEALERPPGIYPDLDLGMSQ